ncbi:hypothetical protein BCR32DRAFT_325201 [Anaeromyces robustus]|uniref:Uncharacterized protein n=1 Tax=Anaeromyces robustus TaxID=1754192 RepID=A0A1Y1XJH6_9FUNG|nr:hypothetical protein BCR32DRAFT_325201 [Anaeromyces robustus]|eukprot:ORX85888.1 hypothetical protein BCR32DRAFT_325201 [Anaeromyces robustus]
MNCKLTVLFAFVLLTCFMSVKGLMVSEIGKNKYHKYTIQVVNYDDRKEIFAKAKQKYNEISDCQKDASGKKWCGIRHCYSFCAKNIAKELSKDMENGKVPFSDGDVLAYDVQNNNKWLVTWNLD